MKKLVGLLLFNLVIVGAPGGATQARDTAFTNSLGMEFVLIPAGQFSRNEFGELLQPQTVSISRPFYLGKYEVTQEQWAAVMGSGPSRFAGKTNPVEQVSWNDVQKFIQKLNEKEGGHKYRLPTEAEWEHAARAGTGTAWFFGDDPAALGRYAWFEGNSRNSTHPVGKKKPNPWGLYDIYGNVAEWVSDWYDAYQIGAIRGLLRPDGPDRYRQAADWYGYYQARATTDPAGPASGPGRVFRGGCWNGDADDGSSAERLGDSPGSRGDYLGFRLAFSPGQ